MNAGRRFRILLWLLCAIAVAALTSGCRPAVFSARPLPVIKSPYPELSDQVTETQWGGTWIASQVDGSSGEAITVEFTCDRVAHLAQVSWSRGEFHLVRGEMTFTAGELGNFLSFRFIGEDEPAAYIFGRYQFTEQGDLVVWWPNVLTFRQAVEAGRLKGKTNGSEVTIDDDPQVLLEFIDHARNLTLFDYQNPLVFKKVAQLRQPIIPGCPKQ